MFGWLGVSGIHLTPPPQNPMRIRRLYVLKLPISSPKWRGLVCLRVTAACVSSPCLSTRSSVPSIIRSSITVWAYRTVCTIVLLHLKEFCLQDFCLGIPHHLTAAAWDHHLAFSIWLGVRRPRLSLGLIPGIFLSLSCHQTCTSVLAYMWTRWLKECLHRWGNVRIQALRSFDDVSSIECWRLWHTQLGWLEETIAVSTNNDCFMNTWISEAQTLNRMNLLCEYSQREIVVSSWQGMAIEGVLSNKQLATTIQGCMFIHGRSERGWWFFWSTKTFRRLLNYVFNFVPRASPPSTFAYEHGMEKSGSWVETKLQWKLRKYQKHKWWDKSMLNYQVHHNQMVDVGGYYYVTTFLFFHKGRNLI